MGGWNNEAMPLRIRFRKNQMPQNQCSLMRSRHIRKRWHTARCTWRGERSTPRARVVERRAL
jgi:hypothetical protein